MTDTVRFGPPPSATTDEERLRRQQRLAAALRLFGRLGYVEGVAGHISVRDPGDPHLFWVNPLATPFSAMRVSDLICVTPTGQVMGPDGPEDAANRVNLAAFHIHSAIHAARPEVDSVAHAHSTHGKAWSTLGRLIDPITQDACAFFEDLALCDHYGGPATDADEAARIVTALGSRKAAILQSHGLLTVGRTVDEAAYWFTTLDKACEVQLLAEAVGTPVVLADDVARLTGASNGSSEIGWLSFQPLYDEIARDHPDLFE
jgi:ribulose-5-phosphate 4-epimerase/fuculose-1-phosphate aldolase